MDSLQSIFDVIRNETPYAVVLTGVFNCRSSQWWDLDIETTPEGAALDELIETNNLHKLIEEPTNICDSWMSCIYFIITDQPTRLLVLGFTLL